MEKMEGDGWRVAGA